MKTGWFHSRAAGSILHLSGLAAALAIIFLPTPQRSTGGMKALSPNHFAIAVLSGFPEGQEDNVRNLVVYPVDVAADGRRLQYASGEICVMRGAGGVYDTFSLCAELPLHYNVRHVAKGDAASIDELIAIAKHGTPVTYAWWASRRLVAGLWGFVAAVALVSTVRAVWWPVKHFVRRRREKKQAAALNSPSVVKEENTSESAPWAEAEDSKTYKGEFYPVEQPQAEDAV